MMATSARAYNIPNVMLMRSESTSADALVAMLASCGAQGMQAPQSVVELEEAVMGGGHNKRPFYPMFDTSEETGDEDVGDDGSHHVEKKRRLSVDQVRSLEKNFELENKLEPERKLQLARELGLQPRQVAVWFQNRRARWKTKQLERDYDVLKMDYDALKSEFESVVEHKENLQSEISRLKSKLQCQPKQMRVDGPVHGAEGIDLDMALNSALAGTAHELHEQQQQLEYQQHSTPAPVLVAGMNQESRMKSRGRSISSESNSSSEIMNADSPHPIDSGLSPGLSTDQKTLFACDDPLPSSTTTQVTADNVDHTSIVQFAEDLCRGGHLVIQAPVKVEDGVLSSNVLQEESNTYFYTMEGGTLPWWEWP